MNEIVNHRNGIAAAAMFSIGTALAPSHVAWPALNPLYTTSQASPTFSFFERIVVNSPDIALTDFANRIAVIFASLSEGQQPLGPEFEAIWDANLDFLYES